MSGLACVLLGKGGTELKKVKENFKPIFADKKAYFDFVDALCSDRELVSYKGDTAEIIW
jgi:hypothetical protein